MHTIIKNDFLTVVTESHGACLTSIIDKNGEERLWQGDPASWKDQAPLLWPVCGSLVEGRYMYNGKSYSLDQHGFGKDSDFVIEDADGEQVVYLLTSNEKTLKEYPFEFELRVIYSLDKNSINVTYLVTNKSCSEMYFSIGSHEGFICKGETGDYAVFLGNIENIENDLLNGPFLSGEKEIIPLDEGKLWLVDDEFEKRDTYIFKNIGEKRVTLLNKKTPGKITVDFPQTEHLLLWKDPGAEFLCVEPWCGLPDCYGIVSNLPEKPGIIKLEKNGVFENTHTITID